MKLHQLICEETEVTLERVRVPEDLIDPKTGKYYTGTVNVTGDVNLKGLTTGELPVKFGTVGFGQDTVLGFDCSNNHLTSLKGAPQKVGTHFACDRNKLTTLQHAPQEIDGNFYASQNKLTSLEGIHKIIKRIDKNIALQDNPIETGGIGLILIEGLKKIIADQPAFEIIEKYLGQGKKGLLLCQDELDAAGYEEYAKL